MEFIKKIKNHLIINLYRLWLWARLKTAQRVAKLMTLSLMVLDGEIRLPDRSLFQIGEIEEDDHIVESAARHLTLRDQFTEHAELLSHRADIITAHLSRAKNSKPISDALVTYFLSKSFLANLRNNKEEEKNIWI